MVFAILAGLFALGSLLFLEGITEGLMPWVIIGCPGCSEAAATTVELHRWHGAEHGAVLGLLFGESLIAMLWRAHAKPLLLQFYALGHIILPLCYGLFGPAYINLGTTLFLTITMLVSTGLLIAFYPAPREVFRFKIEKPASRSLLGLSLLAAVLLAPSAVQQLLWQIQGVGGEHAIHARWTGGVLLILCLVLAGLLAATRRPGWRELAILTGITYLYLGAAALTVPEQAGSWGR